MAKIVYGTLRYDTNAEEGCIEFSVDLNDTNTVVMFDTISDWIYELELLQADLRKKLQTEYKND